MANIDAGDSDCTTGLAKRIFDQITADARSGFSDPLDPDQLNAVKAQCYAAALGVADEVNAAGGVGGGGGGTPSDATPLMDGTAAAGSSSAYARGDHRHPTDTSRAPLASPAFTGAPTAPDPTTDAGVATKGYVDSAVAAGGGGGGAWQAVDDYTVAYWPLGETNADDYAIDVRGSFPLGANGALSPVAGVGGASARDFGTNGYFKGVDNNTNGSVIAAARGEWTFEAWVYLTADQFHPLFDVTDGAISNTTYQLAQVRIVTGGLIGAFWGPPNAPYTYLLQAAGTTVPTAAWTHIAVRKTLSGGTATVDFFVNKSLQDTQSGTSVATTDNGNQVIWLGKPGGFSGNIAGRMQHVRFSRKPRSDQEISDFYDNTLAGH